jgi:Tol biopolymer transport system component
VIGTRSWLRRWIVLALLLGASVTVLAVSGRLSGLPGSDRSASAGLQPLIRQANQPLIVYSEFGHEADTLWAADPGAPQARSQIAQVRHAPGYGIAPALSPDGTKLAYTVLPPSRPGGPDAHAELRVVDMESGETSVLAADVDLLPAPVWAADGGSIIGRRSSWQPDAPAGQFGLVHFDMDGSAQTLVSSAEALFPIDVTPDGAWLYFATLSVEGTALRRAATNGSAIESVMKLSDGVARDWQLSPDGTQLSYLREAENGYVTEVLDLASAAKTAPLGTEETEQFSPIWEPDASGNLTVGVLDGGGDAAARIAAEGGIAGDPLPAGDGFDVPLTWSPSGDTLAVRAFAGTDVSAPGPSRVVIVTTDGARSMVSQNSDVIVAGWLEAAP